MDQLQMIWGWQPALYLFLGGMGAGAFVCAGVLYLRNSEANRTVLGISMIAAAISVIVGLLLLLAELIFPLRGLLMWQSFSNTGSWMTFGAWVAASAIVVFLIVGTLMFDRFRPASWKEDPIRARRPLQVLTVVGIVLGICVAVYTGILLSAAPGVPLWNTVLLPCLFTVSALDTGVALVELVSVAKMKDDPLEAASCTLLERSVVVLVAIEAVVLAAFLIAAHPGALDTATSGSVAATASASAGLIVGGVLSPWFWILVVACGLVVPIAIALYSVMKRHAEPSGIMAAGAASALVGGCALRFIVLFAGLHVDYVADTMFRILS